MICCKIAAEQIFDQSQSTQGNICARRLGATLYFFFFVCALSAREAEGKRNLKQLSATWVDKLVVSTGRDMMRKKKTKQASPS